MTTDAVGGVRQYAADLCRALVPHGIETTLAVLGPPASGAQRFDDAGLRIIETGLPLDWMCDAAEPVLAAGRRIAALAADFDVVQLNTPALAAGGPFPCPAIIVTHGCIATWAQAATAGIPDPGVAWHRVLTAKGLRAGDAVVAPSAAYAEIVAATYHVPAPIVVHNGRRPLPLPEGVAAREGAFTAGRLWDPVKNTRLLDRVAAQLKLPFRAAGPVRGPHGETVAPSHLALLGTLDEAGMAAELAARPVFVSAATFEPFGLAVLEAAQAGCALVLSDIPTFRELWDGAALFVPPHDGEAFAAAIERLLADAPLRTRLGARAHAARYTPAATAAAMARIYAGLIARRGRAAA